MFTLSQLGWNESWTKRFASLHAEDHFPGRVSAEHKELYHIHAERGALKARVSGKLRHAALGRADFPAVGDWVTLQATPDADLAVIHSILPRRNQFSRKAAGSQVQEQIIAANLDTLFLVTSFNRDLNPRRIERYLAAISLTDIEPVLIVNKSDLVEDADSQARTLQNDLGGLTVLAVSAHTGAGMETMSPFLRPGRTVALVGSSGVGKSSLLNRLLGHDSLLTSAIRESDDRGRHTTTHREMILLPLGGLLIDNPGMRELQLWDDETNLDGTFADIAALAQGCFFADCTHQHEPRCAVRLAIDEGRLDPARLESHARLLRELDYLESRENVELEQRRKAEVRRIHRIIGKEHRKRPRR